MRSAQNPAEDVGRTPWSARVPLDPLTDQADEGVGCGPGGPPHQHEQAILREVRP